MKKVLGILVISIGFLSSCVVHSGYMMNSASLSKANFDYTQQNISGSASTFYILGIGGFNASAIVNKAKQDMLKKHPLKPNQALANITVNWDSSIILFFNIVKCTVTADIVKFNK